MAPTCHSLSHTSPCAAQCAVMAADASRSSTPFCIAVVEGDPVFSAVGRRQVDHAPLPELATCLTSVYASPSSSSPSSVRHEWRLSSSRSSTDSASFFAWISNPSHPKLLHIPSFLPNPTKPSPHESINNRDGLRAWSDNYQGLMDLLNKLSCWSIDWSNLIGLGGYSQVLSNQNLSKHRIHNNKNRLV